MLQKKNVLVDGVILNGPIMDSKAGEKFVEDAYKIIMEEVIQKANDVTEKVKPSLRTLINLWSSRFSVFQHSPV